MASSVPFKVFVQTESSKQQENIKTSRKTSRALSVLQNTGTGGDKEVLVGRQAIPAYIAKEKLMKKTVASEIFQIPDSKRSNSVETATTSSQTSPSLVATKKYEITYEDLTSDHPSENYWKTLTKKREDALIETKAENLQLIERIASLENKIRRAKERLDEAKSLAETLTELLEEKENEQNVSSEADQTDQNVDDNSAV